MTTPPPDATSDAAALPTATPAPSSAGTAAAPRRRRSFLRSFRRAWTDPATFDLRANPSLWLGAVLAIPIPIFAALAGAPAWIEVLAFVAPVGWGLVLGAAGRVAAIEREAALRSAEEALRAREVAKAANERRDELEQERKAIDTDLKLASAVQETMVPPDIVKPDVQVVVKHIPTSFVGGDYLQASMPRPDLLYLCVGDVSGHGVAAALVVSRLHGVVRRLILEQRSPVQFLDELNRAALRILQHTYFFVTFAVFRVDLAARRVDYATAGHPAQFLVRADGTVLPLSTPNRLLGMDADVFDSDRPSDSVAFAPGDSLVLFTDGLFEIPGEHDGEILGEAGLERVLTNLGGLPPALVAGDILKELADFQGDSKFEDDVSLMIARFDPAPAPTEPAPATPRAQTQPDPRASGVFVAAGAPR